MLSHKLTDQEKEKIGNIDELLSKRSTDDNLKQAQSLSAADLYLYFKSSPNEKIKINRLHKIANAYLLEFGLIAKVIGSALFYDKTIKLEEIKFDRRNAKVKKRIEDYLHLLNLGRIKPEVQDKDETPVNTEQESNSNSKRPRITGPGSSTAILGGLTPVSETSRPVNDKTMSTTTTTTMSTMPTTTFLPFSSLQLLSEVASKEIVQNNKNLTLDQTTIKRLN